VPSWNGDVRLEPSPDDPKHACVLTVTEPTAQERTAVAAITGILVDRGWLDAAITADVTAEPLVIRAPLEEVGPVVVAALRPGPGVLTAVRLRNGRVEICEHSEPGKGARKDPKSRKQTEDKLVDLAKKPAEAAATVRRPTPSCPDCFVDKAVRPATESLLAFLTPEQHKSWAKERLIVCRGHLSGHRYILAHRSSEVAAKNKRICYDVEDRDVVHFHDWSVPPEEEVLAAKLILEHREPWLRNEATCLGVRFTRVFKNPFGNHLDGVADARLTQIVGVVAQLLTS